ncbi:hypothetical protein ACFLXY_08775 [Chloroflexota bacterium]
MAKTEAEKREATKLRVQRFRARQKAKKQSVIPSSGEHLAWLQGRCFWI